MPTLIPVLHRYRRAAGIAVVGAVLALAAAGCGSDDDNATEPAAANGGSSDAALSEARAAMAEGTKRPTEVTVTKPIDKPIPSGKKLAFISCGTSQCQLQGDIVKEAAAHLGWTSRTLATEDRPHRSRRRSRPRCETESTA